MASGVEGSLGLSTEQLATVNDNQVCCEREYTASMKATGTVGHAKMEIQEKELWAAMTTEQFTKRQE